MSSGFETCLYSYSPISTVVQYCVAQIEDMGWGLSMGERVV